MNALMQRSFEPAAHVFEMGSLEADWLCEVTRPDFDATTLDGKTAEEAPAPREREHQRR